MTFADCLTVFRLMISPVLLWMTPFSAPFTTVYLLCGASDILDGFAARKMHTTSERGAKLDSLADAVFAAVCLLKILPLLTLPQWLWYWATGIFAVKCTGISLRAFGKKRPLLSHTRANKVTGLLLFLLPLLHAIEVQYLALPACIAASIAAAQDILPLKKE